MYLEGQLLRILGESLRADARLKFVPYTKDGETNKTSLRPTLFGQKLKGQRGIQSGYNWNTLIKDFGISRFCSLI